MKLFTVQKKVRDVETKPTKQDRQAIKRQGIFITDRRYLLPLAQARQRILKIWFFFTN